MIDKVRESFALVDATHRRWMAFYLGSALVAALLEATGLALVFAFFSIALNPDGIMNMPVVGSVYDSLGFEEFSEFLALTSILIILAFLLRAGFLVLANWVSQAFRRRLQYHLTAKLFRAYLHQPLVWHLKKGSSRLLNNVANNVGQVVQHMILAALDIIAAAITLAALLATMVWLKPVESTIAVLAVGITAWLFLAIVRTRMQRWGYLTVSSSEAVWRATREPLRGIKTVKVQGLEEYFARRVEENSYALLTLMLKKSLIQQFPRLVLEVVLVSGILLVVAIAFGTGASGTDIIPAMILFAGAASRTLPQITTIMNHFQYMRMTEGALDALREDMGLLKGSKTATDGLGRIHQPSRPVQALTLASVTFRYGQDIPPALDGVNLEMNVGELVALVGLSGAGKTTLADMLLGLIQPQGGRLLIDGKAVRAFPHSLFSYVPQEPFVVQGSLRRNVALTDGFIDEERLERAVKAASLQPVIDRLPDGLETIMNEEGGGLSGGERQRLALARALYADAPVLILDEPTAALDALTEAEISATLEQLRGEKLVVLIAHRLSTIKNFDRVVYMENGKVIDQGSFSHLYRNNSHFRTMVEFLSVAVPSTQSGEGALTAQLPIKNTSRAGFEI